MFKKSKKGITPWKIGETPGTCSISYHNKAMYQVSDEYVDGYGENAWRTKGGTDRWTGQADGQMEKKLIVPSSENWCWLSG